MKRGIYSIALILPLACGAAWCQDNGGMTEPEAVITAIVYLDDTPPAITLESAAPAAFNAGSIAVEAHFSEAVFGFDAADLEVVNASLENFQGSGAEYSFSLLPQSEGVVSLDIPAGIAHDAAGNPNTAVAQRSWMYDSTPPTGVLTINDGALYSRNTEVVLTISPDDGAGSGVTEMQFSGDNALWSDWEPFAAPREYAMSSGDGAKRVYARLRDAAGNVSSAVIFADITLDETPPAIALEGDEQVSVVCGGVYSEQGAAAEDNLDGDISDRIGLEGDTANTALPGTYMIEYVVQDSAGNPAAPVYRTIMVDSDCACLDEEPPPGAPVVCFDFETGLQGFSLANTAGASNLWHAGQGCYGDSGYLYFGDDATCSYDHPVWLEGAATSPELVLPDSVELALTFDYFVDSHPSGEFDMATVEISENGVDFAVLANNRPGTAPACLFNDAVTGASAVWHSAVLDLSPYAGLSVYLRFQFDTLDGEWNAYAGYGVDNICVLDLSVPEGFTEGEGTAEGAGEGEGVGEGEGIGEGTNEGEGSNEGEGGSLLAIHSADQNGDNAISLSDLLRVIQFFNTQGYCCAVPPESTEDGYKPGPGDDHQCRLHDSDYNPGNWQISLSELLRLIQFFNSGGYHRCPGLNTEDGFCPGR